MKQTFLFSLLIFTASFLHRADAQNPGAFPGYHEVPLYTVLVINADVNLVLTAATNKMPRIAAGGSRMEQVSLRRSGDTLFVEASKRHNYKGAGIVYVPANHLRYLLVNAEADIRTVHTLPLRDLELVVNGACSVAISTMGKVKITESVNYAFEYAMDEYDYPGSKKRILK